MRKIFVGLLFLVSACSPSYTFKVDGKEHKVVFQYGAEYFYYNPRASQWYKLNEVRCEDNEVTYSTYVGEVSDITEDKSLAWRKVPIAPVQSSALNPLSEDASLALDNMVGDGWECTSPVENN